MSEPKITNNLAYQIAEAIRYNTDRIILAAGSGGADGGNSGGGAGSGGLSEEQVEAVVDQKILEVKELFAEGISSILEILNTKQNTLTADQLEAVNSGIVSPQQAYIFPCWLALQPDFDLSAESGGVSVSWYNKGLSSRDITFTVYRRLVGGNFTLIATRPGNIQNYYDSDVTPGTTYEYTLSAKLYDRVTSQRIKTITAV